MSDRQTEARQTDRGSDIQTDRQTEVSDRQTEGQTDRQRVRQLESETSFSRLSCRCSGLSDRRNSKVDLTEGGGACDTGAYWILRMARLTLLLRGGHTDTTLKDRTRGAALGMCMSVCLGVGVGVSLFVCACM